MHDEPEAGMGEVSSERVVIELSRPSRPVWRSKTKSRRESGSVRTSPLFVPSRGSHLLT